MLPIRKASAFLGVHPNTLRQWEKDGILHPERTYAGQRRYKISDLCVFKGQDVTTSLRRFICYSRVSSRKQEEDLQRQIAYLKGIFPHYEHISDIASGLNFERPGLQAILEGVFKGNIERIVVAYKDRLARIGFELIDKLVNLSGGKIVVLENQDMSPEEELAEDLLAITTVFSARMHGLRRYSQKSPSRTAATTDGPAATTDGPATVSDGTAAEVPDNKDVTPIDLQKDPQKLV